MTTDTASDLLWLEKDKDAKLNYDFNLADVLSTGDTVSAVTSVVSSPDIAVDAISFTGATVRAVISGGLPLTWYTITFRWVSVAGLYDQFVVRVFVPQDAETLPSLGSDLFPNRFAATATLRRDRLLATAQRTVLGGAEKFSDDYLWDKLRAAESEIRHALRVRFAPTKFFAVQPTDAQIAALAGMSWDIDPGYDYDASFFQSDRWGFIRLRQRPLVAIESVIIRFPGTNASYTIPNDWIRFDAKYADVQFIPTAGNGTIPLNAFMLQVLGFGRHIPFAIQVIYTAGLSDVANTFPELIDAVRKRAVISALEDMMLPQSGSISADGLSESVSVDMDKYRDTIDHALYGGKGRNGGLSAAINGVRVGGM